jgi:hypothetical protein
MCGAVLLVLVLCLRAAGSSSPLSWFTPAALSSFKWGFDGFDFKGFK